MPEVCKACERERQPNERFVCGYCWGCLERQAHRHCPRCRELEAAIHKFLAAKGHDLCHENRLELAAAINFPTDPTWPMLPSPQEFAERCIVYRQQLYGPDGPGSETEVWEAKVRQLEAELQQCRSDLAQALQREASRV